MGGGLTYIAITNIRTSCYGFVAFVTMITRSLTTNFLMIITAAVVTPLGREAPLFYKLHGGTSHSFLREHVWVVPSRDHSSQRGSSYIDVRLTEETVGE